MISSHAILVEREERKTGDRFRRRVNKSPREALMEIVEETGNYVGGVVIKHMGMPLTPKYRYNFDTVPPIT